MGAKVQLYIVGRMLYLKYANLAYIGKWNIRSLPRRKFLGNNAISRGICFAVLT